MQARTTTDKAGSVPMQACWQALTRDYDRSVLHRRIRSSAAAITRLDPGDPDVAAIALAGWRGSCRPKHSSPPRPAETLRTIDPVSTGERGSTVVADGVISDEKLSELLALQTEYRSWT